MSIFFPNKFVLANSRENLGASNITPFSATLNVDIQQSTDTENGTDNCPIGKLELTAQVQVADYVPLFLSADEIEARQSSDVVGVSSALRVGGLDSGIVFCFQVAPINSCTNSTIANRTLNNCAPLGKKKNQYNFHNYDVLGKNKKSVISISTIL